MLPKSFVLSSVKKFTFESIHRRRNCLTRILGRRAFLYEINCPCNVSQQMHMHMHIIAKILPHLPLVAVCIHHSLGVFKMEEFFGSFWEIYVAIVAPFHGPLRYSNWKHRNAHCHAEAIVAFLFIDCLFCLLAARRCPIDNWS